MAWKSESYLTYPHEAVPTELSCLNRWPCSPAAWRIFQTGWIPLTGFAKSFHVSRDLPNIALCSASPFPRQCFLLLGWCALHSPQISNCPSLAAWLIRMKGSIPGFDPLCPLHCIVSWGKNHYITEFASPISISSRVSSRVVGPSQVTSPLWSSTSSFVK